MLNLRKAIKALYPMLNSMANPLAKVAARRLDLALTNSVSIINIDHPAAKELSAARDFAMTIISNG